jgi:hypothetical protein
VGAHANVIDQTAQEKWENWVVCDANSGATLPN